MGDNQRKREDELALITKVAAQCKTAVVTGPAAARWMGLSTLEWVTCVDLCLPGNARTWGRQYDDRVYRGGVLRDEEFQELRGVRVAVGIRALFDSYRYYGKQEALVEIESARWRYRDLTAEKLLSMTQILPQARGMKGFRELIAYSSETSASPLETLVRDALLQAIASDALTGVETIEFQVGFQIPDERGEPAIAWADVLINGFIVLEADGAEKTSGAMGEPATAINHERFREKQLQNNGAVVFRIGWKQARQGDFVGQLQGVLDRYPGVRAVDGRLTVAYRAWLAELAQQSA